MLQLEVPVASSIAAARRAHNAGLFVVLDPTPAASLPVDTYPLFDCLTPNATEAAAMVTMGAQGVCYATPIGSRPTLSTPWTASRPSTPSRARSRWPSPRALGFGMRHAGAWPPEPCVRPVAEPRLPC